MRMYDVIKKKRDGFALTEEEIRFFVSGVTDGSIPDYQITALLMAIFFKDMSYEETKNLAFAIRDSGQFIAFPSVNGKIIDKHSTGGVGDGTSLTVVPIFAACGGNVCMIAGRGLGHTGGTLDKLESIPGFRTGFDSKQAEFNLKKHGMALMGQTEELAPADKKLYALRDVTATVDKIPLIASSIMGKKLACSSDGLVLDVKAGSGAFMKSFGEAQILAATLAHIAEDAGRKVTILITNMDEPLGRAIGNSLEVIQAVDILHGVGPKDITELSVELSAEMLVLSGMGTIEECREKAERAVKNGSAFKKFRSFVSSQGGDVSYIDDPVKLKKAKYFFKVKADCVGVITHQDAEKYGLASCMLGAGRSKVTDEINPYAGIVIEKKAGDMVMPGDTIAYLYADNPDLFQPAKRMILSATSFGDSVPNAKPLILKRMAK